MREPTNIIGEFVEPTAAAARSVDGPTRFPILPPCLRRLIFASPTAAKTRPGARRRGPTQPAALDAQNQPRVQNGARRHVSKRRDRSGRSPDWVKVKNR